MLRVLLGLLLATTSCRRSDPTGGIAGDPNAEAGVDGSVETVSDAVGDAPPETQRASTFAVDRDAAMTAVRSLSPTWKRLTVGRKGGPNPAMMADPAMTNCVASDPDCEWIVSMGLILPERFMEQEECRVHAYTGVVRCRDGAGSLKRIGTAKLSAGDSGAR